jgi:glycosyltransferase involved in cell wall biosynthesis
MIVHAYYEEDPRVRREAESVVASGREVDVFALRREDAEREGVLQGVRIHRLDVQRHQGAGIGTYLVEYANFLLRAMLAVTRAHRHHRFTLVQVASIPDALVFAALPLRLVGVPVILDLHEAMPEFFRMRFPRASNRLIRAVLVAQERLSIAMANAVITVNDALGDRLVAMGVRKAKVTIVRNSPSLARFDASAYPVRPFMSDGVLRLVYAGGLSKIYELEVAIEAVALMAALRPNLPVRLDLYGRDFGEVPLGEQALSAGVADRVFFHGRIPIDDVPAAVAAADIGIAPTRRTEFTDLSLSTKLFEYAAMGKPVVATRLPMVEATFSAGTAVLYDAGSAASMADGILGLVDDEADRRARVAATGTVVHELSWERESVRYLALVERLARDGLASGAAGHA